MQLQQLEKAQQEELEMRFIEEAKKVAQEEADARRKLMLERLRQRQLDEEEVSFYDFNELFQMDAKIALELLRKEREAAD